MDTPVLDSVANRDAGLSCSLGDDAASGFRIDDDLAGADLRAKDLSGIDLRGRDLSGANLEGAQLFGADLRDCVLRGACLRGAELTAAQLQGAQLDHADLSGAILAGAQLEKVGAFGADFSNASLTAANLAGADLRTATFENALLREANLIGADLSQANLRSADISLTDVSHADFFRADIRRIHLEDISGYGRARWIGVDLADVNFVGAYRVRRFILDQNFLDDFRSEGRLSEWVYRVWWLTSDCGRSMTRWCAWTACAVVVFAGLFSMVGIDYGTYPTPISAVYFSVVTLTTLGYGDVTPSSMSGQVVAMMAVITGYFMLGGLLSILSNKMARRGE